MKFPVRAQYKEKGSDETKSVALSEEQVRKALDLDDTEPIPEFWEQSPQLHQFVSGLTATTVEIMHIGHEG